MFKLHKHKSDKSGERVEFRFSHLQASQVPKGWDRIILSIVSVESGKVIAKSSKGVVRNGNCQWSDTLKESIWIPQDGEAKELEGCLCKLVVSMGSAKIGILGEALLNLTDYVNPKDSGLISFPLKRCNDGTILKLKVQGLSSKSKFRDGRSLRGTASYIEDPNADIDNFEFKSDESDSILNRSVGSFSNSCPEEPGNRSLSASGSHRSSDSSETYMTRPRLSPKNSTSGVAHNLVGRQDSTSSQNSSFGGFNDDFSRSNHSSFNSKGNSSQWPDSNSHSPHNHSLRHSDSAKEFLEAAQETIEELRGEARMWEKTARKYKGDFEALKKEFSDQSNLQSELDLELQAVTSERDGLRLELDQLKLLLDESVEKQESLGSTKFLEGDIIYKQKELEDEVKFQKESHANLSIQLKKTQESNIELVSILQELEETVEKQKVEIALLSSQRPMDQEMSSYKDIDIKEEKANRTKLPVNSYGMYSTSDTDKTQDLEKEVEELKYKIQELERDCAELTEENLDLIFKLKKIEKDVGKIDNSDFGSSTLQYSMYSSNNDFEQEAEKKEILSEGVSTEPLTIRFHELEKKCTDLELDLQFYKDKACDLGDKLQRSQLEVEEERLGLTELQKELEKYRKFNTLKTNELGCRNVEQSEFGSHSKLALLISELHKQLQKSIAQVKLPWFESDACVITEPDAFGSMNPLSSQEQATALLHDAVELNKLLKEKIDDCRSMLLHENMDTSFPKINLLDTDKLSKTKSFEEPASLHSQAHHSYEELQILLSDVQCEKDQLEEKLDIALNESSSASKCLNDVHQELVLLTSNMDVQVSTNKMLERKLMQLESGKRDLEMHICELEQENVQLSERIFGLEAQLRYLTNEKEASRLELEDSKASVMNLRNEICKLEAEVEAQKVDVKLKLQETQKGSSEAQEEIVYLKRSHSKLQCTTESLMDECSSLQKINGDLRKQKLELHEKCTQLELELSRSQEKNFEFHKKVGSLEFNITYIQKDSTEKEKSLISQIVTISEELKQHEEKLQKVEIMLNEMDTEQSSEVEALQREVAHLTFQMSSTYDERERVAADAVREVSSLRADRNKLEANLQEALAQVQLYEKELTSARHDSEDKLQGLTALLDASKQSEEMLMADIKRMRKLIEDVKSREEKMKKTANELELKLRASDYEKLQLLDDISSFEDQLQKIPDMQDEILALKSSLDEEKFEKDKLEKSLCSVSDECEEVKAERNSFMEKCYDLQKALSDVEDAKLSKVALEEKLLRLEGDLTAVESLYAQDAELKNEINRIKRANSQYQGTIQCLEEERDELLKRLQDLENELKLKNREEILHEGENWSKGADALQPLEGAGIGSKIQKLENELAEALHSNDLYQTQLKSLQSEKQTEYSDVSENSLSGNGMEVHNQDVRSSLESELKEMQERYLQMSLRYAEVEAQREEMVMKLKSFKKEKRWFS